MPTTENKLPRKDDGGPAFPQGEGAYIGQERTPGMSLRDYFAAHALSAVYAHAMLVGRESQETIVAEAYELADSMLEERAK